MVQQITDSEFKQATAEGLTLVDFWAPWCGPCKMQAPELDKLANEVDDVAVFKMNVDDNPETARQFAVMSIPTLLVQKDGEVVETLVGFHNKDQLKAALAKHQ